MNKKGAVLAGRTLSELKELRGVVERAVDGWGRAKKKNDDYYIDGVALNLHGFYSGLERIFERIAIVVDGSIPSGANWHWELLNQMSTEIPGIRRAVISDDLKEKLGEYKGFRHVVRNVYTYKLNPFKMEILVSKLFLVLEQTEIELIEFIDFLQNLE